MSAPEPERVLIPLSIPVPPELGRTLGYPGVARLVGFCWQPAGDELEYDDGRLAGAGDWRPWLLYTRHRAVAPHLAPYDL